MATTVTYRDDNTGKTITVDLAEETADTLTEKLQAWYGDIAQKEIAEFARMLLSGENTCEMECFLAITRERD